MSILKQIMEQFPETNFYAAEGLDSAIIGVDERGERLVYSVAKILDALMVDGLTYEEALEYYEFNVGGAYWGEKTPIWCWDILMGVGEK